MTDQEYNDTILPCYPKCLSYAKARLPKDKAEDAVQTAFASMWEKRERYDLDNPMSLLIRMCKNAMTDEWRKSSKRPSVELREYHIEPEERQIGDYTDPVQRYLETLSPKSKKIIIARSNELKYKEIAEDFNANINTVRNLLYYTKCNAPDELLNYARSEYRIGNQL